MELTLNAKIRIMRKLGREWANEEMESHYYAGLMGPYSGESISSFYDKKRIDLMNKLGVTHPELKKAMKDIEQVEWIYIPEEFKQLGTIPQVHEDLVGFYHASWEGDCHAV
ncbi:hypothetical protein SP15_299 [Bacillus phage SP-15]|uniref:Uncharacterized protein n=1 Tax=Bacillus phage SP-15 TaxID=1792032 RepID=A0A127AWX6_9CAUD|nr:hypothetical protein SP15_299 [Bacillus phage SP-15]AMM45107.1 hypothetical protein SP15_299 [Bacillus phage SP-15]